MRYTVKEVAELTGVTIKTLYHYQKVGLLMPCELTEAGYRLYGDKELELLQQILFYRELDFSLHDIKQALTDESSRLQVLLKQQEMLFQRKQRTEVMLQTLSDSIVSAKTGEGMDHTVMFKGLNKQEWQEALAGQKEYLQNEYQYDMDVENIDPEKLNELASEPEQFMSGMARALREDWRTDDERVHNLLENHIAFINEKITAMDAQAFVAEARYFVDDDFHRSVLESQQAGLSYYLFTAASLYADSTAG